MNESDCEFMSDDESTASNRLNKSIIESCNSSSTNGISKSKALKKNKSFSKSSKPIQQTPIEYVIYHKLLF